MGQELNEKSVSLSTHHPFWVVHWHLVLLGTYIQTYIHVNGVDTWLTTVVNYGTGIE